jgi:hypothetical protein
MSKKIEEQYKKLEEKQQKISEKKRMLLGKEKRQQASKFTEIGRLAYRANIDKFDEKVLFGAFLEIAQNLDENHLKKWQSLSSNYLKEQEPNQVISIFFQEDPSKEIKQKLKSLKFIWNRFKNEFCGRGQIKEIEELLKGIKYKIEEIQH